MKKRLLALTLWLTLDNPFYPFSFAYIGACLAPGLVCLKRVKYARSVAQFAVYLLG